VRGGDDGTTTTRAAGEKHGDFTASRTLLELTTTTTIKTATKTTAAVCIGIRYKRKTNEQKNNGTDEPNGCDFGA